MQHVRFLLILVGVLLGTASLVTADVAFDTHSVRSGRWSDPQTWAPIDDLPPATIITSVQRQGEKLVVRGVSEDNGTVARVSVNGRDAKFVSSHAGVVDWEIAIDSPAGESIEATATDAAGNVEKTPAIARPRLLK